MQKIKPFLILGVLLIATIVSHAESVLEKINISPFATYRVHEFGKLNGKFGGGLAAGFQIAPQIAIEAEVIAERFDDSHWLESLTEAGVNFKIDLLKPSDTRVITPYLLVGYSGNLDYSQHRMNTGAGLELRLGDNVSAFGDLRWTQDFGTTDPVSLGHGLARAGFRFRF